MLRFTKPKLSRVVWAVRLDKGPTERWKLKPQVCACSQGEDEPDGARAMEKAGRFQEGGRQQYPIVRDIREEEERHCPVD